MLDTSCFFVSARVLMTISFCVAPFCSNRTPRDSKRGISFRSLNLPNSKLEKIAQKWFKKLSQDDKFLQ